jgi:hypothetical protein
LTEPETNGGAKVGLIDAGDRATRRRPTVFAASVMRFAQRHRTMVAMLVICVASVATRADALFISDIDWDEGVYLIMAQRWTLGGLPYVAVWDQHPPGLPAVLAMVQKVVPDPVLGARLAALLLVTLTALLIHRFCARYLNQAGAGLIAALLYIVCMSRWLGLAASPGLFNNACVTLAAYLLYGAARRSPARLGRPVVAALVLGVGLQIKYVIFPEAALLCLGYLVAAYRAHRDLRATAEAAAALVLAGLLPTCIAVFYFWANGALQPFLDANIGSNIDYLDVVPGFMAIARGTAYGICPIVGAILITAYAIWRGATWRWLRISAVSPHLWILLWTVAAALDALLPLKFFTHYYFALYPPLSLAGALALTALVQGRRRGFAVGVVVLFATALPFWAIGVALAVPCFEADAPRAVAAFLRQAGGSNLNVFVYDDDPVIYALAGLPPPIPYLLGSELSTYTHSSHVDGAAELRRAMDSSPDFVVVRTRSPRYPGPVALDDLIRQRLTAYHLVRTVRSGVDHALVSIYGRSAGDP